MPNDMHTHRVDKVKKIIHWWGWFRLNESSTEHRARSQTDREREREWWGNAPWNGQCLTGFHFAEHSTGIVAMENIEITQIFTYRIETRAQSKCWNAKIPKIGFFWIPFVCRNVSRIKSSQKRCQCVFSPFRLAAERGNIINNEWMNASSKYFHN